MANYYNLTGWKRTGFDMKNRPYSREVLEQEYFRTPGNYFTMQGIVVKRDDMLGLSYIELPGSVKDIIGDQENPPSQTGPFGPGGPFYSWEEVDYIRLVRNGYPGDVDYVDISNNMDDPWNTPHEGKKLFIGYYFVVGMAPAARNSTYVFLSMDEWLSMGGPDELEIEAGAKIRGHITDSEDASSYNMAAEPIGITEPLITISNGYVNNGASDENYDVVVSAIDLAQYDQEDSISGFVAQASSGQSIVFPAINAVSQNSVVLCKVPTSSGEKQNRIIISDYGFFDVSNELIKHNMSILYSAGQIELQDSYTVPKQYGTMVSDGRGAFTGITNNVFNHNAPVSRDIGDYPRKADYMYGQLALYSLSTGAVNIQPYSEVTDAGIYVWALLTPSGSPVARFKGIKGHVFEYDQSVSGMPWVKKAIVMQGASGSMWTQISYNLERASITRAQAMNIVERAAEDKLIQNDLWAAKDNLGIGYAQSAVNMAQDAAMLAMPATAMNAGARQMSNAMKVSRGGGIAGELIGNFSSAVNYNYYYANTNIKKQLLEETRRIEDQALKQRINENKIARSRGLTSSPYVNFVPDLNAAMFQPNGFGVQSVNTTAKDRKRLKDFFKRYGYSGLYQPLTFDKINVKQKVNYIECSDVLLRHEYYPLRVTMGAANVLHSGVFFWNQKPDSSAFDDNPDN